VSISAMKQALEALESWQKTCLDCGRGSEELGRATQPIAALRQAIAEAEKQEPDKTEQGRIKSAIFGNNIEVMMDSGLSFLKALETTLKTYDHTTPVHASDISQERVDETAKRKHEWVGLDGDIPGLGLVTEEFYNGMLCAEDILRKRNT
jgi:hypothetical protein